MPPPPPLPPPNQCGVCSPGKEKKSPAVYSSSISVPGALDWITIQSQSRHCILLPKKKRYCGGYQKIKVSLLPRTFRDRSARTFPRCPWGWPPCSAPSDTGPRSQPFGSPGKIQETAYEYVTLHKSHETCVPASHLLLQDRKVTLVVTECTKIPIVIAHTNTW